MSNQHQLDPNTTDAIASVVRGATGFIPFFGNTVAEIILPHIQNQWQDRVTNYLKILEIKLADVPLERIKLLSSNEYFLDLIEESVWASTRAISVEAKERIASLIANGIDEDRISYIDSKSILKIYQELNEKEIIWLRYFLYPSSFADDIFRTKHKGILGGTKLSIDSSVEEKLKNGLNKRYKSHLEQLRLIEPIYMTNMKKGFPTFNSRGEQVIINYRATTLGKMLLLQIGIIDEFDATEPPEQILY